MALTSTDRTVAYQLIVGDVFVMRDPPIDGRNPRDKPIRLIAEQTFPGYIELVGMSIAENGRGRHLYRFTCHLTAKVRILEEQ